MITDRLSLLILYAVTCDSIRSHKNVSSYLKAVKFLNSGLITSSSNYSRVEQCSSFSECYSVWTCGSPRDYLWDVTAANGSVPSPSTVSAPPLGLRSSVPLGGLGSGTFELRGDGTFADWTIENQGTALAANAVQNSKIPLKEEAFLGIYVSPTDGSTKAFAASIQTSPSSNLPEGVEALTYSGAYPFSRLIVNDSRLPLASASIFAYSYYTPGISTDPATASGLPFVAFSLQVSAPAAGEPVNVSFLLSLPLSTSVDTLRPILGGRDTRNQTIKTIINISAPECLAACSATDNCSWWTHSPPIPAVPDITRTDHDCAGDDIYSPARVAFATLQECIEQCNVNVSGCNGLVFDQIPGEQGGQCGNSDPNKYCCLPKTSCTDYAAKTGDTAWARGTPGVPDEVCSLFALAPAVEQFSPSSGVRSGVRGEWTTMSTPPSLTLRRLNTYDDDPAAAFQDPASATSSYSLLSADIDDDVLVTFATNDNIDGGLWTSFASSGLLSQDTPVSAGHGAVAAMVNLLPGETRSITLIFGWHVPNRTYVGQEIGNHYAIPFADALEVALSASSMIEDIVSAGLSWNQLWTNSTLPLSWQDFFLNSVSTQAKMSVWVAKNRFGEIVDGGRYRQFEAFSNCDLAPVHVLSYSMWPYILYFPDLLQNTLLTGWAAMQLESGMIREFLGDFSAPGGRLTGEMDISAGGRVMGDVTSVFILATLGCVRSSGNMTFLKLIWPSIVLAAQWQISRSAQYGCPEYLQTTYDYLRLDEYPLATYNAVLHLATMRAVVKLAALVGDNSMLSSNATLSESACLSAIGSKLWSDSSGMWRAWQTVDGTAPDFILSGSLHGQSWASALGLGLLLPIANATRHLDAELALNCKYSPESCAFGLLALPGSSASWANDASPAQSMDATAVRVIFGAGGLSGSVGEASIKLYREVHRDFWHWMDLHVGPDGLDGCGAPLSGQFLAGQAFVNSHYQRQLQGWAALLATTGQNYDAVEGTLHFTPSCEGRAMTSSDSEGGFELRFPFFSPKAIGLVFVQSGKEGSTAELTLINRGTLTNIEIGKFVVGLSRCGSSIEVIGTVIIT